MAVAFSGWIVIPKIEDNRLGGIVCREVGAGAPLTGGGGVSLPSSGIWFLDGAPPCQFSPRCIRIIITVNALDFLGRAGAAPELGYEFLR